MSYNLGFIGGGNMSTSIFNGIIKAGFPTSNIWVSGPHLENLQHWLDLGANINNKNGPVYNACDVIFLGVKPQVLIQAISDCVDTLPPDSLKNKKVLVVSMLAGISIKMLQQELKILPGEKQVIRILPNTPMSVGAGACLYTPDSTVTEEQCKKIENLLSVCGICEKVPEHYMGSLGSLIGCGPAFMYMAIEALADGAVKQGAPRALAIRLAAQMVMGSGKMVLESKKHPGQLKDEVCSPGGSTISGVAALEDGRFRATLINAMEAAVLKTQQMGKN